MPCTTYCIKYLATNSFFISPTCNVAKFAALEKDKKLILNRSGKMKVVLDPASNLRKLLTLFRWALPIIMDNEMPQNEINLIRVYENKNRIKIKNHMPLL